MLLRLAADLLALTHLGFVIFVIFGSLLVWRRPRLLWLHLPAVAWGFFIEISGWICPLTPWENDLRRRAGQEGYPGGFVEYYLLPILYPGGLTREIQILLGTAVLALNLVVYGLLLYRGSLRSGS